MYSHQFMRKCHSSQTACLVLGEARLRWECETVEDVDGTRVQNCRCAAAKASKAGSPPPHHPSLAICWSVFFWGGGGVAALCIF